MGNGCLKSLVLYFQQIVCKPRCINLHVVPVVAITDNDDDDEVCRCCVTAWVRPALSAAAACIRLLSGSSALSPIVGRSRYRLNGGRSDPGCLHLLMARADMRFRLCRSIRNAVRFVVFDLMPYQRRSQHARVCHPARSSSIPTAC